MTPTHAMIAPSARLVIALTALFSLFMLANEPAGDGVGFRAGLTAAIAIAVHLLVFGASAARRALPPLVARLLLVCGVFAVLLGLGAPRLAFAAQIMEAGLFAASIAAPSLILLALAGRVPTLRSAS
jgi:multisubunit Na+/H+ antiporter MnhB subunit